MLVVMESANAGDPNDLVEKALPDGLFPPADPFPLNTGIPNSSIPSDLELVVELTVECKDRC